jgi:hypothetical protein
MLRPSDQAQSETSGLVRPVLLHRVNILGCSFTARRKGDSAHLTDRSGRLKGLISGFRNPLHVWLDSAAERGHGDGRLAPEERAA